MVFLIFLKYKIKYRIYYKFYHTSFWDGFQDTFNFKTIRFDEISMYIAIRSD